MHELAWEIQGADVDDVIEKARSGDLAAFEELIRRHERLVLTTALHLNGNREDAQDAAQQVFLRLYRHLSRFDQDENFPPWLYRVTVNVCRDLNRRKRGRFTVALDMDVRSARTRAGGGDWNLATAANHGGGAQDFARKAACRPGFARYRRPFREGSGGGAWV